MELSKNKNSVLSWIYSVFKKYLLLIGLVAVLTALVSVSYVVLALLSKQVLDIATGVTEGGLASPAIAIIVVIVLQLIFTATEYCLSGFSSAKLTVLLRTRLFDAITAKKYAEIREYHSGDLLNRITSDGDVVVSGVVDIIPQLTSMLAKIIGGVAALVVLDYRIALIILVAGLSFPAIGRILNKPFKRLHGQVQKSEGQARVFMQESFENTAILKTFSSSVAFKKRLGKYLKQNLGFKMKRRYASIVATLGLYTLFTIGYYGVLLWGAEGIMANTVTYGTLMAFLQLVQQLRAPLQNISGILPKYYSMISSAERLMEIEGLDTEISVVSEEELHSLREGFETLEIDSVSFAYGEDEVLENCSFIAKKGTVTAVIGGSGSGKSTLLKLILGLFEPASGKITVNGERAVDSSVRPIFAYVPQGNAMFSGTVRDNLTLMNGAITEEALIKAAQAAEIYDFLLTLPDGFDTLLSERGSGLSEGQLQRLSVARALLTDAPVLLLDEATSALDEATETKLLDNIKAMRDKTVIFVTHRNTSLRVCDNIIKID